MSVINVTNEGRCNTDIFTTDFSLGKDPYKFRATNTINKVHRHAIRFGKTNDISVLYKASSTKADRIEYVMGASTMSMIICTFILLWFSTIILLQCLGSKRVGLFSGKHPTTGDHHTTEDQKQQQQQQQQQEEEEEEEEKEVENQQANDYNGKGNIIHQLKEIVQHRDEKVIQNDVHDDAENVKNDASYSDSNRYDFRYVYDDNEGENVEIRHINDDGDNDGNNNPTGMINESNVGINDKNQDFLLPSQHNSLDTKAKYRQRLNRARVAVLFCSFGTVICIILFLISGIRNLRRSSNDVVTGLEDAQELATVAMNILNNFIQRQGLAFNTLSPYIQNLNEICPDVTNTICTNVNDVASCNYTNIPFSDEFIQAFEFLISNVDEIPALLSDATAMRSDLGYLFEQLESVSNRISSFSWAFSVAALFAVALLICKLGISYGIIAVWHQERQHFNQSNNGNDKEEKPYGRVVRLVRQGCMVPVFCVLVVISWMFSMIFVIGNIASADFCYGTPDDTVVALLEEDIIPLSSLMQKLIIFYVEGCPDIEIVEELESEVSFLSLKLMQIQTMINEYNSAEFRQSLTEICGSDPVIIDAATRTLEMSICNLGLTLVEMLLFFSCDNWRPIYRRVTYDAVCFDGNEGFYYTAWTQFWIVIFAMIMVTLRVAFKPGSAETNTADSPSTNLLQTKDRSDD